MKKKEDIHWFFAEILMIKEPAYLIIQGQFDDIIVVLI